MFELGRSAGAQENTKIRQIGFLAALSQSAISARVEAFRQGLAELGYAEGKNIVIDYRWANGKFEQVPCSVGHSPSLH
jgi:putative ABC transport system substrate-binding protein